MSKLQLLRISLIIFFILFSRFSKAQINENYVEGSIEFQSGKIAKGFIKDDEIKKMNYNIYFKDEKQQEEPSIYPAAEIKKVTLSNGEVYDYLKYKHFSKKDSLIVLGKLRIKGKASLYEFYDYESDMIFMITRDGINYPLKDDKLEMGATELKKYNFRYFIFHALEDDTLLHHQLQTIKYYEKDIVNIVSKYNEHFGQTEMVKEKAPTTKQFLMLDIGGMNDGASNHEFFVQFIYRIYYPKFSKSTSLNTGINFYKFVLPSEQNSSVAGYKGTLVSVPLQFQQNLLNKKVRPYLFLGFNLSYLNVTDMNGSSVIDKGFQRSFGVNILYGGGIEADIFKNFRVKSEFRHENFRHLILFGVGYNFLRK